MEIMFKLRQLYVAPALVCAGVLAGCATSTQNVVPPEQIYAQRMSEADAMVAEGKQDAAVLAYEKIAADNPTQGTPWAKVAQIQFAQGHYSQAIVAAEETLRRDPTSREAKSVTAVGGLRLAVRSLEELRNDTALAGDAKTDAVKLALMLRETLNEPVLEPKKAPVRRPAAQRPAAQRPAATTKPAAAASELPAAPKTGGNPFGALQ